MLIPLTREVAEFIAGLRYESLPAQAVATVRNGMTDCTAVIILGRHEPVVRALRSVAASASVQGEARLCFGAQRAAGAQAALVNGTAAHALDYDDIGLNSLQPTHPSAVLVPAIFAEAEALGCTGREMIAAYAAGYEVWGELASRERSPYHLKGWHPTATFGAVAAAAAAARLHHLDAVQAAHAIGIAASQAGGLVANFGSMTKPFHAGRAASAGVLSARLAAAGMTAAPDALEHRQGFLRALSPAGEVDLEAPTCFAQRSWLVEDGLGFKLYPMCYGTHRALDAVIALAREHDLAASRIVDIVVEATDIQMANLVHHDPQTALHAKFSMEFAVATALLTRRATLAEVADKFVQRPDVRSLMKKVRITVLPDPGSKRDRGPALDGVIVTLDDGTRLERRFDLPLGHARRPAGQEAMWAKFADCTRDAMDEREAHRLFECLQTIEDLSSLSNLPVAD